jgi:hypothetical protein
MPNADPAAIRSVSEFIAFILAIEQIPKTEKPQEL